MRRCADLTLREGENYFKICSDPYSITENKATGRIDDGNYFVIGDQIKHTITSPKYSGSNPKATFYIKFITKEEYDENHLNYPDVFFNAKYVRSTNPKE